jgi:F-type H+-transporting ATPase subunit delta
MVASLNRLCYSIRGPKVLTNFNMLTLRVPLPQAAQTSQKPIVAGDAAVLARRYADALYELADEQKVLDAVAADLRTLRILQLESAEFRYLASQPRLTRAQLIKAMNAIGVSAHFHKLTANFMALVAKNRRLAVLGAVIEAFLNELAARRGEFTADVCAARALSPAQEEQLASKLRELAGGKVHLFTREDKSLIGGMTVKMGSRLIDASVRTKLQRLERQLKSGITATQGAA